MRRQVPLTHSVQLSKLKAGKWYSFVFLKWRCLCWVEQHRIYTYIFNISESPVLACAVAILLSHKERLGHLLGQACFVWKVMTPKNSLKAGLWRMVVDVNQQHSSNSEVSWESCTYANTQAARRGSGSPCPHLHSPAIFFALHGLCLYAQWGHELSGHKNNLTPPKKFFAGLVTCKAHQQISQAVELRKERRRNHPFCQKSAIRLVQTSWKKSV